jgi:hypothetical protein
MVEHQQEIGPMRLVCPRVQAIFPAEGIELANHGPAGVVWDEHGGTFIIRVEDLLLVDGAPAALAGIRLEVALSPSSGLAGQVQEFAANHGLPVTPRPRPLADLLEAPILCACHVPGKSLFIYCENSLLKAKAAAAQTLELAVTGSFQARRLPSRENDVVIHLAPAAMVHLLSFLLALADTRP